MNSLCDIYRDLPADVRNGYRPYRVKARRHVSGGYSDYWLTDMGDAHTLDGELLGCQIYLGQKLRLSYYGAAGWLHATEVFASHVNAWALGDPWFVETTQKLNHGNCQEIETERIIRELEKFNGDSPFQKIIYNTLMPLIKEESK